MKRQKPQSIETTENIQVTAAPVKARQFNVQAGQPGNHASRLAQALTSLQPALKDYVKKDVAETEDEFQAKFGGMTLEQSEKYYKAGLEEHSGLYKVALNRQYGIRMASEHHKAISEKVASGEIDVLQTGAVEQAIFDHRNQLGKEPPTELLKSYDNGMASFTQKLRVDAVNAQGKKRLQDRDDNFAATINNIAEDFNHVTEEGALEVQDFMSIVKEMKATNGKGTDLNMSNSSFNDIFLNFAATQSEKGNYAVVKAVLEMDNGSAPSLLNSNLHGKIAASYLDKARTEQLKRKREDFDKIFVEHYSLATKGLWTKKHQRAFQADVEALNYSGRQQISMNKLLEDTQEDYHGEGFKTFVAENLLEASKGNLDKEALDAETKAVLEDGGNRADILRRAYNLIQTNQNALDSIARDNKKKRKAQNKLAAETTAIAQAELLFDQGMTNKLANGIEITEGEGDEAQTVKLSQTEAEQRIMEKKLSEIAAKHSDNPQAGMMAQVEFLIDRGDIISNVVKEGIEDAISSLSRLSKDEDFDPTKSPSGAYLQVYEMLKSQSPVRAAQYAGEDKELLNTLIANRNFHGDWSKAVRQTLIDLERSKNGNIEFSELDRALYKDSSLHGWKRSHLYDRAKQYMKFNGGDERQAIKQAKKDFDDRFVQFGSTDTYIDTLQLPTYVDPVSHKTTRLSPQGVDKIRSVFEDSFSTWYEEEIGMDYEPDQLRIVQLPGEIMFTYANNMIDDAFTDEMFEEGRIVHKDISKIIDRANQNKLKEIKDMGDRRRATRKASKGLNSL